LEFFKNAVCGGKSVLVGVTRDRVGAFVGYTRAGLIRAELIYISVVDF
jgi:hypothetical protein